MLERKFCIYQPLDQGLVVCHKTNTEMLWTCRIRYPDPAIKVNDTVKINLATGKIDDFIRFDTGVIAMATGGRNMGRVGVITHRERHDGGFNIVHIKDAIDNEFATRESNVFVIGREKPWISLPKGKGVKVSPISLPRVLSALLTFRSSLLLRRETAAGLMLWLVSKCGEKRLIPAAACWRRSLERVGSTEWHTSRDFIAVTGLRNVQLACFIVAN